MKIAAGALAFASQHTAISTFQQSHTLRVWAGPRRPDVDGQGQPKSSPGLPAALPAPPNLPVPEQSVSPSGAQSITDAIDNANNDPILQLIRTMLELLTGYSFQVFYDEVMRPRPGHQALATTMQGSPATARQDGRSPKSAGIGIEYDRHMVRTEAEQIDFVASGAVRTTDGREIQFQLNLRMQRRFSEEIKLSLRAGDAARKDPLVINFAGTAAQLSSQRFKFDLAGDGQKVDMPMLASNSGYLALDLNANGEIDSGKELFGPISGNGFADLARHDSDGNGWIDENDPIYDQLRIWTPGTPAGDTLASLQDAQVGALFLGQQATPFELRDASNGSLGAVRSSGIYLAEDGSSGTLQQIDLSV